jgi:hypothetical protein
VKPVFSVRESPFATGVAVRGTAWAAKPVPDSCVEAFILREAHVG